MKTFSKIAAQGDVMFLRIDDKNMPDDVKKIEPVEGKVIVAHSETGHHHVMEAERADLFESTSESLQGFLLVHKQATLEHQRSYHTHEPIQFEPGLYQIRRQREHQPEGWRRVQD